MLPMLTECLQKLKAAQVPLKEVSLPRCTLCTAPANPYGNIVLPKPPPDLRSHWFLHLPSSAPSSQG